MARRIEREDYTKVPPPELWPDSGKGKRGPTPLQRKYFIDRVHPDKRPHRHTFDLLLSVGGFGSGKSMGEVIRIVDTCLRVPGTNALIGGIDLQALKRNIIGIIAQIFTYKGRMWSHPAITNVLSDKQTQLKFANGSIISLVNLTDFLKVVGVTVGIMGVEEPHLLPNGEESFKTLVSRLRANKPDIRQMILCTNPETTTDGWMNRVFELDKLEDLDTSDGPAEMLVGKPCDCQICISCKINYKKECVWVKGELAPDEKSIVPDDFAEDYYCPNCFIRKDFYIWKGEKFHCPGNQKYMRVLKSETMHNAHVPADVIQSMRDQYDDATFDIFVKGNVNKNLREDYVYTKFDEETQFLQDMIPINFNQDIYWGLDWNRKPQSSVIAQFEDIEGKERFVTKSEICLFGRPTVDNPYGSGGASAKDVAREFSKRYKPHYKGTTIHLYGDPAGFKKTSASNSDNYEILAEYLEEEGFVVSVGATDHQIYIKDRIATVEHWLEDGLILFNPKDLIEWTYLSFKECKWDDKDFEGRQPDKKQDSNAARATSHKYARPVSHFNEALGYMICSLFPLSFDDLRAATLPDGTTIREDRRGNVIVDKAPDSFKESIEGSWEHELAKLKKQGEPGSPPQTLSGMIGFNLPKKPLASDDDGT